MAAGAGVEREIQRGAVGQKPVEAVPVEAPSKVLRRRLRFAGEDEKKTRYHLPNQLDSTSPVGYRARVPLTLDEAKRALQLLSLTRPAGFVGAEAVEEQELFEECSLGVLSARQSTNFRGHRQVTFGPKESRRIAHLLRSLDDREAPVLDGATHTHVVLSRPYRTAFTMLLTLVGHKPVLSLLTVPKRIFEKKVLHADDMPSIGFLQQLHVGILADAMERAAVIASEGRRKAQVFSAPFCSEARRKVNRPMIRAIEELCGVGTKERAQGWRVALVVQVGVVDEEERVDLDRELCRKVGANLMAFRSERIQPGVNQEESAPPEYQERQEMDVPEELTVQAGRAAYNAFAHWTGCDREFAKELLLLERIDVVTPNGKERIRQVRTMLDEVADQVMATIPKWIDWPVGKAFSRNAERGKKAFGLAGQRIYIGGLSRREVEAAGLGWEKSVRAVGAAAARSGLVAEIMGVTEVPEGCDLLAGLCLMAGPINQNDLGKTFYGQRDLLMEAYPDRDPTSLLVWTLKAKTVADPIGNEEQLMNEKRKGKLVDLRPGPHEVVEVMVDGRRVPMRSRESHKNRERAFGDRGNFVVSDDGREIPGNRGEPWPAAWRQEAVWSL